MTLIDHFGRFGYDLYRRARGISNSPVKTHRARKSIGKERTYGKLLYRMEDIQKELSGLAQRVVHSLGKHQKVGKTIVVKIRYADFQTLTKRRTLDIPTNDEEVIKNIAWPTPEADKPTAVDDLWHAAINIKQGIDRFHTGSDGIFRRKNRVPRRFGKLPEERKIYAALRYNSGTITITAGHEKGGNIRHHTGNGISAVFCQPLDLALWHTHVI